MTTQQIVDIVNRKARKQIAAMSLTSSDVTDIVLEIEQTIRNYCQLPQVPAELIYTAANMATDLLIYDSTRNDATESAGIDTSNVSEVKVGDTTVKLGQSPTSPTQKILSSHSANMDNVIMNYRQQLNMFRRLV